MSGWFEFNLCLMQSCMAKARFQPLPHRGEVAGGVGVGAFDDAVVVVKVPPDRSSGRTVPARTLSATLAMDRMRSGIPTLRRHG